MKLFASSRHWKTIPLTLKTPLLPLVIAYLQRNSLIVQLPISPQFSNFCVFQILIPKFDLTITSVPQHLQTPFTTHFKATHIGVNMNAVSVSQSITIRRYNVMNKWVLYFGTPCSYLPFQLIYKVRIWYVTSYWPNYKNKLIQNWTFSQVIFQIWMLMLHA